MARILFENATVRYPVYSARAFSLRNNILALGTGGRLSEDARHVPTVTALDSINLDLQSGDRLGLIGHNGSGKSTLLRTMAGIFRPASGRALIDGRVSTVFGLGAGLQEDLSGYDNIMRMSMMLGASRREAKANIPEIEEFTELGDFLSLPVSTYSDGMRTRLTFAVATAAHPEILLIDEVLGAGDASFQERAKERMGRFIEKASIFVLASHSQELIEKFTNRVVRLEHGQIVDDKRIDTPQENLPAATEEPEPAGQEDRKAGKSVDTSA